MASKEQIKANRENAKKSTGPRTNSGKARTAKNALKHGLLAQDAVLPGEDPADFDQQLVALEELTCLLTSPKIASKKKSSVKSPTPCGDCNVSPASKPLSSPPASKTPVT